MVAGYNAGDLTRAIRLNDKKIGNSGWKGMMDGGATMFDISVWNINGNLN